MKIKGIEGVTIAGLQYCFSFIVMSFKQPSAVYFIGSNENAFSKAIPFNMMTLLFGWWGIPWGPVYSIGCLFQNINGGKDVTEEVMQHLQQSTKGHVFEFEPQAAFAY
jgi:hypothetical protein